MADFKSVRVALHGTAQDVFDKLSSPEKLRDMLNQRYSQVSEMTGNNLPDNVREALKNIELSADDITIKGGPTGEIKLRKGDNKPFSLVKYDGVNTPVPIGIEFHIYDEGTTASAQVIITANIPIFMKPMIAGPMDKAVKMFASLLEKIPAWC
jgi:hypothetical protein